MEYIRRIIDDELDDPFPQVPAQAIDGPKAVGKTTTAQQRVHGVLRLDSRASRTAVEADPELVRGPAINAAEIDSPCFRCGAMTRITCLPAQRTAASQWGHGRVDSAGRRA